MATSTKYVEAKSLPPTSAATRFHSLRVWYQIQDWKGKSGNLDPQDWGWSLQDQQLVPVKTNLPPAPTELLSVVRCNCKTGCDNLRCTCRRHGIDCSPVCGECKGLNCMNSVEVDLRDVDDDDGEGSEVY